MSTFPDGWEAAEETRMRCRDAMRHAFSDHGYDAQNHFDHAADVNMNWLNQQGAFASEGDDFTGIHYSLRETRARHVIKTFLDGSEVAKRIERLGPIALGNALRKIALDGGWENEKNSTDLLLTISGDRAPASDRIVSFSDNQSFDLDQMTSEVIEAVSVQNQIDGAPGLREIVLGQLKAGRELIRAGSSRLYLLELTLIHTLQFLVRRYEREAIGGLASALIVVLLKHIGMDA